MNRMGPYINKLVMLVAIGCLMACGDENPANPITFNSSTQPTQLLEANNTFSNPEIVINTNNYEFGGYYQIKIDGRISKLGTKIPESTNVRVTLWDFVDQKVLATANIQADSGEWSYAPIPPVQVSNGDQFLITIQSNSWYEYLNDQGSDIYPIKTEYVDLLGYGFVFGTGQVFPVNFPKTYYAGLSDMYLEYNDPCTDPKSPNCSN